MRLVYLIGDPGVGKTTLTRALLDRLADGATEVSSPVPHELLWRAGRVVGAHLGRPREWFGGTDALAMNVQPAATAWLTTRPFGLVVGEGDRLGNGKFFAAMTTAGIDLAVVHVTCPPTLAEARRVERGSRYHPAWLAGRRTKVARLAPQATAVVDASRPPDVLADELLHRLALHPEAAA
jgi:P-loop Nucleotide Kinase3